MCMLLCCTFPCSGHATIPQFYHGYFFPVLYSGHQIFLLFSSDIFSSTIVSFLPHFAHLTLLPASLFLYFHASEQLSHHIFFSLSPGMKLCPWFSSVLVPLQLHPSHSTNVTTSHLVFQPFSSNAAPLSGMPHALLYFCAFSHRGHAGLLHYMHYFFLSLSPFYLYVRTFPFIMFYSPIFEILYFLFFYYLLSSYFYFLLYSILHHPTCYHLKFILGNWFPLYFLPFIPAVIGQMPEPFTALIHLFSSFFQFCPQFSKSMLLVKQVAYEGIVLSLRYYIDVSIVQSEQLISLAILYLLGCKMFTQPELYYSTNYYLNTRVKLSPNKQDL